MGRKWRVLTALLLGFALVAGACGSDDEEAAPAATTAAPAATTAAPAATTAAPAAAEPETDSIVVANRLPNLSSNVIVEGTSRKGWFDEEGLTVQTVQTEDVRAALASGSAQIAAMEPGLLMQARDEGLDFVVVAGHRCGSINTFAIQPDIPNAAALSGKDVLVGGVPGTPDADFRLALLKVNGWDLSTVDGINYVTVPGGSNAWTELFYEGKLAITPFFGRHMDPMVEYGANIAVNTVVELPDEFWVTTRDFLDNNPNAVGGFVRQAVRMGQYWLDPANFPDILEVMDDYASDTEKEGDLSISQYSFCPNSYVNEEYTQDLLEIAGISDIEPMSEWASLEHLLAAQAEFGMNNEGTPGAVHSPFKFEAPVASGLGDGSLGTVEVAAGEDIQIRALHAISGDVAFLGVPMSRGVDMAVADYGDIGGHSVNVGTWLDDLCSSDGGQAAAQTIVADESVVGVLGTSCSGAATAAAPLITGSGMVLVSGSNTSPALTSDLAGTAGDNYSTGYYRTAHNDLYQGAAAAKFAVEVLGISSAAAIHDGDPYTEGLATAFADAFAALGGDVTAVTAVNKGDTDMVPVLTEVAAGSPEMLFFPIFMPEGGFIVQQVGEVSGLGDAVLMGADGLISENFMALPESEGVFMSGPDLDFAGNSNQATGQTGDGFLEAYEAEHGETPAAPFWGHAYDATTMLLDAIAAASYDDGGTLVIDRAGVRESLSSIAGYSGIIGVLTCDDFGDCGSQRISVIQHNDSSDWQAGTANVVFTYNPASSAQVGDIAAAAGLAAVCPSPIVIQTDWFPEAEHGGMYELVGDGYSIDADNMVVRGPGQLGGVPLGIDIEIRTGGPAIGWSPVSSHVYTDDSIHLGYRSTDQQVLEFADAPMMSVVAPLDKNPQMIMWDPDTYPDVHTIADLGEQGIIINVFGGGTFPSVFVADGIWSEDQIDPSYDGSPAVFIASGGEYAQQGFASAEPYQYEHVFEEWGKPVRFQLLNDAGFPIYSQTLGIRVDDLETLRPCLELFVPVVQQAVVDYDASPDRANAIIVDAVVTFDSFWSYDLDLAAFSASAQRNLGLVGNGPDSTVGNMEASRIQAVIDKIVGAGMDVADGLTVDDLMTNEFIDMSIGFPEPDYSSFDANGDGVIRIGVAAAGPADDGAYYQAVVDAAIELSAALGFEDPIVVDEIQAADAATELSNLAEQGVDIIVVGASEIAEPLPDLTEKYPDIFWYCNCGAGFETLPGLAQTTDDSSEISYSAGYASGLLLQDRGDSSAAFIGCCDLGFEKEAFLAFEMGLQAVDPSFTVTYVPTGAYPYDFDNVPNATEAFNNAVATGVGVVYPYLGGAHEPVVQLANESGVAALSAGASDVCTREGDVSWDIAVRFDGGDYVAAVFPQIFDGRVAEGDTKMFRVGVDPEPGAVICNATAEQQAAMDAVYAEIASGAFAGEFGAIKGAAYGG